MKKHCALSALLALACALSLLPAAGAAEVETVHTGLWEGREVFVDGTKLVLQVPEHDWAEYVTYEGSVYLPLHTAEELMGATSHWDEKTATLALTTGGTPFVRDVTPPHDRTQEENYEEKMAHLQDGWENGVDVVLRPDVTLTADGKTTAFSNAAGATVPLLWFREEFYLPVRGVGELAGWNVLWLPGEPWLFKPEEVRDFDALFEPYQPRGENTCIHLYTTPTQAQLDEAQAFLDRAKELYQLSLDAMAALPDPETASTEELLAQLRLSGGYAEELRTLTEPDLPLFRHLAKRIKAGGWDVKCYRMDNYVEWLEQDEPPVPADWSNFKDVTMLPGYYALWSYLQAGQRLLDAVEAQTYPF